MLNEGKQDLTERLQVWLSKRISENRFKHLVEINGLRFLQVFLVLEKIDIKVEQRICILIFARVCLAHIGFIELSQGLFCFVPST